MAEHGCWPGIWARQLSVTHIKLVLCITCVHLILQVSKDLDVDTYVLVCKYAGVHMTRLHFTVTN